MVMWDWEYDMTDKYEIKSKSGNVTGYIEKQNTASSYDADDTGFWLLLLINPFFAAIAGIVGALVAALLTNIGKTLIAAIAKAMGALPSTRDQIFGLKPFDLGQPFGYFVFGSVLLYLTFKWFKNEKNREEFIFTMLGIIILIAIVVGWGFVSNYASS